VSVSCAGTPMGLPRPWRSCHSRPQTWEGGLNSHIAARACRGMSRQMELAARHEVRVHFRWVREDGRSWNETVGLLGLSPLVADAAPPSSAVRSTTRSARRPRARGSTRRC
jgi:hypothetical protein